MSNMSVKLAQGLVTAHAGQLVTKKSKSKQSLRSKARLGAEDQEFEEENKMVQAQQEEQPIAYLPKPPVKVQEETEVSAAPQIDLQQAILWSEILGEPRCRSKHRRTGRRYGN